MLQQMYLQLMKTETNSRIIIHCDEQRVLKTLNQNGFVHQTIKIEKNFAVLTKHIKLKMYEFKQ